MVKDLLLILLGLDIGTASPRLATLVNDALTRDWGHFMSELHTDTLSFIIEAVIFLSIAIVLVLLDKREKRIAAKNAQKITDSNNRIVDLLVEIKELLGKR